jgi:hypothetical protein
MRRLCGGNRLKQLLLKIRGEMRGSCAENGVVDLLQTTHQLLHLGIDGRRQNKLRFFACSLNGSCLLEYDTWTLADALL